MIVEWDCRRLVTVPTDTPDGVFKTLSVGTFRRRGVVLEVQLSAGLMFTGVLVLPLSSWDGMRREDIAGELSATVEHYKPVWLRFPTVRIVPTHTPGMAPPRGVCFWPPYPEEVRNGSADE